MKNILNYKTISLLLLVSFIIVPLIFSGDTLGYYGGVVGAGIASLVSFLICLM